MPAVQAAVRPQSASMGAILFLTLGLVLYQATTLTLGPARDSRVLQLSLAVPTVDLQQFSDPLISKVNLIVGSSFQARVISFVAPVAAAVAKPLQHVATESASSPSSAVSSTSAGSSLGSSTATACGGAVRSQKKSHYHDADEPGLRLARRR